MVLTDPPGLLISNPAVSSKTPGCLMPQLSSRISFSSSAFLSWEISRKRFPLQFVVSAAPSSQKTIQDAVDGNQNNENCQVVEQTQEYRSAGNHSLPSLDHA
ncbi:hypothetical protein [Desulfosarcina alkanivorans]|jgi:hypothetical protein|uniref:hypothetical protein n=1 Tax=Desulfosarcina alkanivorans TaxID=571177 RepID=UPI0012D2B75D|nr:hypothetical protein [Desulfosarcina alkanivorans]